MAGMARYGLQLLEWLDWLDMAGNGWKCVKWREMARNYLIQLEMAGTFRNGWIWLEIAINCHLTIFNKVTARTSKTYNKKRPNLVPTRLNYLDSGGAKLSKKISNG